MNLNRDIESQRLMYWKGFLFLVLGSLAVAGLVVEFADVRQFFLLAVAIWAFCRFYYFLFYVIEKYADSSFRFAGIGSFLRYWLAKRKQS